MLTVVAGLIEADGKILVCQRRRGDTFALMWEFPGGKLQVGESPAEGLERELLEELGVEARVGEEVFRTRHRYAEMSEPIELIFFAAAVEPAAIRNIVFESMEWRAVETLSELNFLPADQEFVGQLARRETVLRRPAAGIAADGLKRDPSPRSDDDAYRRAEKPKSTARIAAPRWRSGCD
jgi:8-oxo-dGTP diphosphatase